MSYPLTAGAFNAGDIINTETGSRGKMRASIVCFRHAVGNNYIGSLCLGADLLFEDGKVGFCFLHDIARWNPDLVAKTFAADQRQRT